MIQTKLLQEIYNNCNNNIFKLDELPWEGESKVLKNIITFSKRRISVIGFQKLVKKKEINNSDLQHYENLLEEGLILEVKEPENYVLITELGVLYLNTALSGHNYDHFESIKRAKELIIKSSNELLKRKCENVFSIDLSNQEAVFALFLLLNGARSLTSAFQLLLNSNGEYMHGKVIIDAINSIYTELTSDDEFLIKDEKELRNVIGRNGKNGRLSKAFPDIYKRDEGKIWLEINQENNLLVFKKIISDLISVLSKDYTQESVKGNLVNLIEKYMINNPVEPYIIKDLFLGPSGFDNLVNLHIVSKDILENNN